MYQGGGAKQIRVVCVSLGPVHERPEPASETEKAGRENWLKIPMWSGSHKFRNSFKNIPRQKSRGAQ